MTFTEMTFKVAAVAASLNGDDVMRKHQGERTSAAEVAAVDP
jgi:hypothetical protein